MQKRSFATLDGMRGVAAFAVMAFHAAALSGPLSPTEGYLAVDFFFLLSGFILEHAYGSRLADGLGARRLMGIRLVRLYPLYLAGTVVGLCYNAVALALINHGIDARTLLRMSIAPLFFLPSWTRAGGAVYPLDIPAWSLLTELAINLCYAWMWRWLDKRILLGIVLVSAAVLMVGITWHGSADVGANWGSFAIALPRVSYSFFLGVLIYRTIGTDARPTRLAGLVPALFVLLLFVRPASRVAYDDLIILTAFPLLLIMGARMETPHRAIWTTLGGISYALYATHYPVLKSTQLMNWFATGHADNTAPWAIAASLGLIVVVAWLLHRFYDQPVRRLLQTRWAPSEKP